MPKKVLGFKHFINVDYKPGEDDIIKIRAVKRKKGVAVAANESVDQIDEISKDTKKSYLDAEEVDTSIDEVLNLAQRRKIGMRMKRLAPQMKIKRKRAMMRTADLPRLKRRAAKQARNFIFKKLSKAASRSEVAPQRRAEIEKRLAKMKPRIDKLAVRMLPQIRKLERDRKSSKNKKED